MKRHELHHPGVLPGMRLPTSEEAAGDWLKRHDVLERARERGEISEKQYQDRLVELEGFGGYARPLITASPRRKPLGRPSIRVTAPLSNSRENQVLRALAKASRRWRSA